MICNECGRYLYPEDKVCTNGDFVFCEPCAKWFSEETATLLMNTLKGLDESRQYCFAKYGLDDFACEVDYDYSE